LPIIRLALSDKIVPKKTKTEPNNGVEATTPAKAAGRAKAPTTRKKSSSKSGPRSRKPRIAGTDAPGAVIELQEEEVRLRAYFIAERRHRFDLPGDADSDWLEAKRQLLSELAEK
jgi:hypothetical protein